MQRHDDAWFAIHLPAQSTGQRFACAAQQQLVGLAWIGAHQRVELMRQREYAMPVVARQAPLGEIAPPLVPPRFTAARTVTIAALVESQHGPLAATTDASRI